MVEDKPLITIYKFHNISSAHKLDLPYSSKCNNIHGHNYKIEMWVTGIVDKQGMVVDFHDLKKVVNQYDHIFLNDEFDVPTTAENIAVVILTNIRDLAPKRIQKIKVRVWETETAYAEHSQEFDI